MPKRKRPLMRVQMSLLMIVALLCACSKPIEKPGEPSSTEATLLQEFKGAYIEEAPTSTGVREFEMTAKPSVVSLFEGRDMEVWAFNEMVPGPNLRVKLGETIRPVSYTHLTLPTIYSV